MTGKITSALGGERRSLLAFLALYGLSLAVMLSRPSLWLDEIIDLHQIRDLDLRHLLRAIPLNAGGVPLSYLFRDLSITTLGYSAFSARLPSLLCSLAALAGIYEIAKYLKLRWPLLPVVLLAVMPCQFRYAIESRPYSQLLALTVWSTLTFLLLQARPSVLWVVLYTAINIAGLYTQPFAIFVPLSHFVWTLTAKEIVRRRLVLPIAVSLLASAVCFYPWYQLATRLWSQSPDSHAGYAITAHSFLVLAKEVFGAGYLGTLVIFVLCVAGLLHAKNNAGLPPARRFWILTLVLPMLLPFAADSYFGYFWASRQAIAAAAPAVLVASRGIESLHVCWHPRASLAAFLTVLLISLIADLRFYTKPRENWAAAAASLHVLANSSSCIDFTPAQASVLFTFFDPSLASWRCPAATPSATIILVARSPYDSQEQYRAEVNKLKAAGYVLRRKTDFSGPSIELFEPSTHR